MKTKSLGSTISALALTVALAGVIVAARAQANTAQSAAPAGGQTAQTAVVTAGQSPRFKNLQVLKDIPADQLVPTMQFISASLGVDCDFCHVGQTNGQNNFDKDDKRPKTTARHMIQMQMAINKDNFNGNTQVTCYSCHRGSNDPVGVPAVMEADMTSTPREPAASAAPANPPSVDQIIDKWVQASGGVDAINKVSSRVETGKLIANNGTQSVEILAKAPNKRISIVHTDRGDSPTAYDGNGGWLGLGANVRDMTAQEAAGARMDAVLHLQTDIKQTLTRLRATRPDKVDGKEMYTIAGTTPEGLQVRMYFDEQSGLLTRMVRYTPTPLGRMPVQVDYSDYRDVNGVKVAYKWTLARPQGRFSIQLDDVKQNVPVDDSKFTKPAAAAANPGGSF
ncbi:MAG TPA: c-type cytochrome [Candidatus Acidoferrales bacterium]|nr:c-type cytochrome [Candidatus Acidoferrales bacterium]